MKVKCSCNIKESSSSISYMNINKAKLFENFKDIKNMANFNFLVCYKNLFKKVGIINNIGNYLLLSIILFHIVTIFVFYINDFVLIKSKIELINFGMNKSNINNFNAKDKKNRSINNLNEISIYIKNNRKKGKKNKIKKIKPEKNNSQKEIISKNYGNSQNKNEEIINISKFIDEEINELSYNEAIQYDKRVYCEYYFSLIKTKHSLFFALFNKDDYNSKIIKIDLFFIGFTIDYIVNALFYNDDTMHKIYKSKGEFDFEAQLPIIVYSTLISMVLNSPLNFLALSNDAIVNFKQDRSKYNIMNRAKNLKDKLKTKFIIYFIISFLLLSFFWYYISMFCVIYSNTQKHLLKDTLISFVLSLIFPFAVYLFPGFFRILALSNNKNKRECLYNFSKFLQSFY